MKLKTAYLMVIAAIAFAGCGNNGTSTDANMEEYESTDQARGVTSDTASMTMLNDMKEFAAEAKSDGMMEVQMAEVAMEQASSEEVKSLAGMIKSDHEAANAKLMAIASANGWELPDQMMPKHQKKLAELKASEGGAFDDIYLSMMEEGHIKAINKFEDAIGSKSTNLVADTSAQLPDGAREESMPDANVANNIPKNEDSGMYGNSGFPDEELNGWIKQTLPVLRKHLEHVQATQDDIP